VVGKGIEQPGQLAALRRMGCALDPRDCERPVENVTVRLTAPDSRVIVGEVPDEEGNG